MTKIQISQITSNDFLRKAALESNSETFDDYIDKNEINLFENKAKKLLKEGKCTKEEFCSIFGHSPDNIISDAALYATTGILGMGLLSSFAGKCVKTEALSKNMLNFSKKSLLVGAAGLALFIAGKVASNMVNEKT